MPRAAREEQLLGVAEEVFGQHGYQATTMEEVADRAGITKPVIYDLFGSKEGLLAAGIARARGQLQEAVVAAWRAVPAGAPGEESCRAGIRAFFDFMDEHAAAWSLLQHERVLAAYADPSVEELGRTYVALVVAALRRGIAADVTEGMLEGMVEGLIGACERVALWRTRRPGTTAHEAAEIVLALTWRGMRSLAPTPGGAQPRV